MKDWIITFAVFGIMEFLLGCFVERNKSKKDMIKSGFRMFIIWAVLFIGFFLSLVYFEL